MKNGIKEIYLSNLKWTKTHDNIGGVMGNVVFKDNMSYEEYNKLFKSGYFVLCNKDYITNLQTIEQQYSAILSENAELENKITNLQEEIKSANESITWWSNRFNAVQEENKKLKNKLKEEKEKLQNSIKETNKKISKIDKKLKELK